MIVSQRWFFLPTSLEKEEDLERLIDLTFYCDVLRLEDFNIPKGKDPEVYIRSRIKKFNHIVIEYIEMCREYLENSRKRPVLSRFKLDPKWEFSLSEADKHDHENLEELFCLDQIKRCLRAQQTSSRTVRYRFRRLIQLMEDKYQHYDVNNFARIVGLYTKEKPLNRFNLRLAMLYLHKFRAIYDERYEEAARIQGRIEGLETKF